MSHTHFHASPSRYTRLTGSPSLLTVAFCLLVVASAPRASHAQTSAPAPTTPPSKPDPAKDPSLNDPSLDDDILGKRRPPTPPAVPLETSPSVPSSSPPKDAKPGAAPIPPVGSLTSGGPGVPLGKFVPEGTFLSGTPGAIVRSPGGAYLFVPSAAGEGLAKAVPMVLMPNQRLSQVASAFNSGDTAVATSVSGQAFVFHNRQYLLLSVFSMSHEPVATPKAATGIDADVKALMDDLDARPSAPRAMDQRILTPDTPAGRISKDSVIAEGTVITGRRARLIRGGSGLSAMFDNGPSNPNLPAMPLLQCRLLEQLDSLAASRGENLTLKLSGRTTVHNGRNYLLPTMYQVIRPGDIKPMQ